MARFRGFVGQSYNLRNTSFDCQRTINMYPEVDETQLGKAGEIYQLTSTPGLTQLIASGGASGGRCLYIGSDNNLYYATAGAIYIINGNDTSSGWTKTLLTTFVTTGPVQMTDNGTHLFVVSDGAGITINLSTYAVATIDATVSPSACTFLDGYVVMTQSGTNQFYWTDLYSTNVEALSFASAEANPDDLISVLNNNEDLWLFGRRTIELWYNGPISGSATVFQRRSGVLIETGLAAVGSVCKANLNRLIFLARDDRGGPVVMITDGYTPKRVSTFAMEQAFENATAGVGGIESATAHCYTQDGHTFYVLNVPGLSSTWVYDITTSEQLGVPTWHERQTSSARNPAEAHAYFKNKHIVSDYSTGAIYFYDQAGYTDNGTAITRQRVCPHIVNDGKRVFYNWLQIDMKVAQGTVSYPNPTVTLEYSNDGGNTWVTPTTRGTGKAGVGQSYSTRVIFNRLGQGRDRVFRVTMSDPVFWAISGAAIDATPGNY